MKNITTPEINTIINTILEHENIVIFHHIRPDGDCLGSQFGLGQLIKDNFPNKNVKLVGDSKKNFAFLKIKMDENPDEDFMKNALAIIVDANFKDRIENRELLDQNLFKTVLRIDHHPNNDDLNNPILWVDPSYVAAAEQIADIAYQSGWKVSPKAANYIYLGIYTDSGRFLYKNTSARTFKLASFLIEKGANLELIHNNLTKNSFESLKYQGYVLNNFKTEGSVVYFSIDLKTQSSLKKSPASCVRPNYIANIEGYPIWVFFVQEENKKWRVEYRSNGPIVRNVALKWGGGGHEQASGCLAESEADFANIIADCNEEITRWKNEKMNLNNKEKIKTPKN